MRYLRNEDGVALITALMFTMICLGMTMMLLYYVLAGIKMSAAQKSYKNALEASYGGTDVITKAIIPPLFNNYSTGTLTLMNAFGSGKLDLYMGANLKDKITKSTDAWGSAVSNTVDPKVSPDLVFTLKGKDSGGDFKVYSKIVDTVAGVGLVDATGIDYLDPGAGVSGTSMGTQTPRTPNIYSIEIQGEKAINPKEKASLSVLYAY